MGAAMLPIRGLSPPTRGILSTVARRVGVGGSIPAYAGDPRYRRRHRQAARVYPRLRGGSPFNVHIRWAIAGLSPPTRGIQTEQKMRQDNGRSIPAYAGDPAKARRYRLAVRVYPRLRGGSGSPKPDYLRVTGLSPPTRGIRLGINPRVTMWGSIPAYAGDPVRSKEWRDICRVYPRLRGGSPLQLAFQCPYPGLSPPTRGIPQPAAQR